MRQTWRGQKLFYKFLGNIEDSCRFFMRIGAELVGVASFCSVSVTVYVCVSVYTCMSWLLRTAIKFSGK